MQGFFRSVTTALALVTVLVSVSLAADGPQKSDVDLSALVTNAAKLKCQPLDWALLTGGDGGRFEVLSAKARQVKQEKKVYACLNAVFDSAESCSKYDVAGTHVIARLDKFMDVFVPINDDKIVNDFFAAPGLVWIEVAQSNVLPPPARPEASKERTRGIPDPIVSGGKFGLSGKGVIVAVIDTGIDFNHPDFVSYDDDGRPTSRILYYWDTLSDAYANGEAGSAAPVTYPNGAPIGTVYSRAELTAELAGQRTGPARIVEWDTNGHGTGCAGIAAGNGNASKGKYQGVAPGADIIAVRVGGRGSSPTLENTYLINAIAAWLDDVAGKRPLVVSCSFGGHDGPHDGTRIDERHLSARFAPGKTGRAICIAAGNEGDMPMHAEVNFGSSGEELSWTSYTPADLNIYVDAPNEKDVLYEGLDDSLVRAQYKKLNPTTKHTVIELRLNPGKGRLVLKSDSGKNYVAHAYLLGGDSQFSPDSRDPSHMVGTPATSAAAIAVGSYNWNDRFNQHGETYYLPDFVRDREMLIGELSGYSNPGQLTDDGFSKPNIVAPGQWFTAPASTNSSALRETSGFYQLFNGTSAATPYMAGVIALALEKDPSLTAGEIRQALKQSASQDQYTGRPPNPQWGSGKLNLTAVERLVKSIGR